MAKHIVVHAPPGLSLDYDPEHGMVRAVPSDSRQDDFLILTTKPPTTPTPRPIGGGYPLPPIIMSFRTREALPLAADQGATVHLAGEAHLGDLAGQFARMEEGEVRNVVLGPRHGG